MRRAWFHGLLLAGLLAGAGCASYERRWQTVQATPAPDAYAGAWQGTWKSARHPGEGDTLLCILTPVPGSPGAYRAEFKARWLRVFSSAHEVVLQTQAGQRTGERSFVGNAQLSTLIGGGTYTCAGTLSPTRMTAQYRARYDEGTFSLTRGK